MMDLRKRLLTWFDVESVLLHKVRSGEWAEDVAEVQVYADGVDIYMNRNTSEAIVSQRLTEVFGDWYSAEANVIYLEKTRTRTRALQITFLPESELAFNNKNVFRPLFKDVVLFPERVEMNSLEIPRFSEDMPSLLSFYSFKGGVGRTLHLLACLKALSAEDNNDLKILVVDADLEAPGLTWWAQKKGEMPEFSYLDFLALAQYDRSENYEETLELAVSAIKEMPVSVGKTKFFFLPAFRTVDQLMRLPVAPEHLMRGNHHTWSAGDLLFKLGKALGVTLILVDLRAGMSELTAPLLFDFRTVRFLVSTYSLQSVGGMKLVLSQLAKVAPNEGEAFFDPIILFSMVPLELKDFQEFQDVQEELISLYPDNGDDDATPSRLVIDQTYFNQELLYLGDLESAWKKLAGTSVYNQMKQIIESLPAHILKQVDLVPASPDIKKGLNRLEEICTRLEHAESGEGTDFLPIPAIQNLGQRFVDKIPLAVVIGSKGAGKTYMCLQLVRLGVWGGFLDELRLATTHRIEMASVKCFPFLESYNLEDTAKGMVERQKEAVWQELGRPKEWNGKVLRDAIRKKVKEESNWDVTDWRDFWIHLIGLSLGMKGNVFASQISLEAIQDNLKALNRKVIILIDGLEDIFQNVKADVQQQNSLNGLLEIPEVLRDYRENFLGVICFIRRDLLRSVIKQNMGQYESRYRMFDLTWDFDEALRLALWVGQRAEVINPSLNTKELIHLEAYELSNRLIGFWGRKLGAERSKEAITANWVLAALSDFNGQLQARDLVRFLKYAARESKLGITYPDRFLQPMAIRRAIEPCSKDKIAEFEEEFTNIESVFNKFKNQRDEIRKVPFTADVFDLTAEEIELLETLGVLRKAKEKYYIPEIFRYGLGFTLDRGARPTVLAWKRKKA